MSALPADWDERTRFLECDARDTAWLEWLVGAGRPNVLALAAPERLAALRARAGGLAAKLAPWEGARQAAGGNDAEVLVLSGDSAALLRGRRSFARARHILVPRRAGLLLPVLARRALGNLRLRGTLGVPLAGGGAREHWLLEGAGRVKERARLYLSPELGTQAFFAALARRGVRYAVLRWFDDLPRVAPGSDVDLLVHDEDRPALVEALGTGTGTIPIDAYCVWGSQGGAYRGACYLPSALGARLLERAADNGRGVRVPCPEDAFLSLAFHALYHKGEASGLSSRTPGVRPRAPKHDFASVLAERARALGIAHDDWSLEGVDALLEARGWKPPRDTLRKWARRNAWIRRRWFAGGARAERAGVAVFVVRRRALEQGLLARVASAVERHGFEVLETHALAPETAARLAERTRGGNWARGDFPADGGPPAAVLVAWDPAPTRLRRRYRQRYPDMDNGRIVCKRAIREELNAALPEAERSNFLHSSDNAEEAWEYVRHALPEREEALRELVRLRRGV